MSGDPFEDGLERFEAGEFEAARRLLEQATRGPDPQPEALFVLGAALERLGQRGPADQALRRAAELDPERYCAPFRVSDREFDRVVEEALGELPAPVREALLAAATIVREDYPSEAAIRAHGTEPLLLGECVGTLEETRGGERPAEVILYRRNLEKVCADRDELREQIVITLYHEVGHALGLDEDGVAALGLE